ncbi:MAG: S9 family peptidase [Deltaproteobacteria bacterium]|jgi:dipeptidyl aminopeptidase/acylaminoacyl peptidase|nr:S9 family peptidase [Deltaproteobacteria bacterium]MBW2543135.1 S9 family peptidase [Deltaproteobacteria bacterium]
MGIDYRLAFGFTLLSLLCAASLLAPTDSAAAAKKDKPQLVTPDDYFRLGDVGEPRISPDGRWIAYTVGNQDLEADESSSRIWMVPAAGGDPIPLSAEGESSSSPRWSPDGKYLGFLSSRDEGKTQVWTLFREGGEAVQQTDTAQGVNSFEWSPDGKKLLLVLRDPKPEELEAKEAADKGETYKEKTPPPWVVTRRQFKLDYVGYLDNRRTHLYVFDLASKEIVQITSGDFDDSEPAWSPDGTRVAFVSNRTAIPDDNYNTDIWVVAADNDDLDAKPLQITTNPGPDGTPSWSADGSLISHTSNIETGAETLYGTNHLAISSSAGGKSKLLTRQLDRMIFSPRFSKSGDSIYFLLEDSGELNLARMPASGGAVERLISGPRAVSALDQGPSGEIAVLISEPHLPAEVFLYKNGSFERRSHVNDAVLASLRLGSVEEIRYASADGTEIEAFVVKPPNFSSRRRYPGILRIHGGPQAQYDFSFHFEAQLYASNGYVVVMPNPRGSTGYGRDFCMGIWQAWGEPDFDDVMGGVDYIVDQGWAHPDKLAVTGWSYGGMLTNHVITKTDRFKAAATGASATLYIVNFGHDQYQRWWRYELGLPWNPESRALYDKISPFNRVENVTTPTLILGGKEDWNVPIINSEQLYFALKLLGVPTELVVYPDEFHGIDTPSHAKDLFERYLVWFGRYLKGEKTAKAN